MTDSENKSESKECSDTSKFLHSLTKGSRQVFILWLLSKNRMHGYSIISKINEAYEYMGVKVVHSSTIYPLLHSLEEQELIDSFEEYNGNKKIKSYETNEKGIERLNEIKKFIKSRPENKIFIDFLEEMIHDNNEFQYKEVNK